MIFIGTGIGGSTNMFILLQSLLNELSKIGQEINNPKISKKPPKKVHDKNDNDKDDNDKKDEFVSSFTRCCKEWLVRISEKESWEQASNALSAVSALHPMTRIAVLLKIAGNSKFPAEVRAFASAMVNDALSHMKSQHLDQKTAKTLVSLLSSTPDAVKDLVYPALRDSKKIEENSKLIKTSSRANPREVYSNLDKSRFLRRSLTLA